MITALAPQQNDRAAWHGTRIGRFTASTFGQLMTEPRSKAAKDAGEVSETAKALITAKAVERLTGTWISTHATYDMRRGLLLEPAAIYLLSELWKPIDACTWVSLGDNCGATPDGLVDQGTGCMDLKCPSNPIDVVRFADEVTDGDFESLLAWDRNYAWQIMVQAICCGVDKCHLVYFTDRLPIMKLTDAHRDVAQTLIDDYAERQSMESEYPWSYTMGEGIYFAAKSFTLTDEIREKILATLEKAEAHCVNKMDGLRPLLNKGEAVMEVAEVTTAREHDSGFMVTTKAEDIATSTSERGFVSNVLVYAETVADACIQVNTTVESSVAKHGLSKAPKHMQNAVAVLQGTINDMNE